MTRIMLANVKQLDVAVVNGKVYGVKFDGRLQAITEDTGQRLLGSHAADPH